MKTFTRLWTLTAIAATVSENCLADPTEFVVRDDQRISGYERPWQPFNFWVDKDGKVFAGSTKAVPENTLHKIIRAFEDTGTDTFNVGVVVLHIHPEAKFRDIHSTIEMFAEAKIAALRFEKAQIKGEQDAAPKR